MKLIFISGPSGSGKTTLSNKIIQKNKNGFVFDDFADLVNFFSFFKGVSEVTALLNRIDFSLLKNLEIIAMNK